MGLDRHLRPRPWKLRAERGKGPEVMSSLAAETGLSELALQICLTRGLEDRQTIEAFLNPRFEALTPATAIKDMDRAVQRLVEAREKQERIRIFGDYDVDGTTGTALLSWFFRETGFIYDARQPDRFKDGYGLNVGAVEAAAAEEVQVLLTVDCGISSFEAATKARELGISLVVVDHHQLDPVRGLPPADAVVNPQRADCPSGLRQLCGCGLAFYLSIALRAKGRELGWFAPGAEPNLRQHLDLVVMATAADMVPLTGDNHVLVRQGLEVLRSTKKPGVRALLQVAGLNLDSISPGHLGFVIGPRINASGRMQSAGLALELLTTQETGNAMRLAQTLEKLNTERAELQNQIWDQVRAQIEQRIAAGEFRNGIVVGDAGWHEGVVGIVASRVTETFRRPAAVIALRPDFGKGSVRSYGNRDVLAALRESSAHLLGFGGHKHAAGLSLQPERLDDFARAFDAALARPAEGVEEETPLWLDGTCVLDQLTMRSVAQLERLGPFGPGNPEPVFSFVGKVASLQTLKGRHLKMVLVNPASNAREGVEAIWFHGAERADPPQVGEVREWAGVPELNHFRGRTSATIRVKDARGAAATAE